MLDAIHHFGILGVVKVIERADQVAGDAADTLKIGIAITFVAAAFRALVIDNAGITANRS